MTRGRTLTLARTLLVGTRSARGRLAAVAAGVAVAVALVLLLWGAGQGLQSRDERIAWLTVGGVSVDAAMIDRDGLEAGSALVLAGRDRVGEDVITRRDLAVTDPSGLAVPDLPTLPGPGEYLASPALAERIAERPAAELGDRYGDPVGTLPPGLLSDPGALVVLVGGEPQALAERGAVLTEDLTGSPPLGGHALYRAVLLIGGLAVLIPLVQFLAIVTGLGASARRHQVATLRVLGATPGLVRRLVALETGVTALVGALAGVGLWWLVRPLAARIPMGGTPFSVDDLTVGPTPVTVTVAAGVAVAGGIAWWRVRGSGGPDAGPLADAAPDAAERTPRTVSVLPLLLGVVLVVVVALVGRRTLAAGGSWPVPALQVGFVLVCGGLLLAGPWFTHRASRLLSRRSASPAVLVAAGRLERHSAAVFRAVGGMVVAVFSVSVFAGAASSVTGAQEATDEPGMLPSDVLVGTLLPGTADTETDLEAALGADPGVTGTAIGTWVPDPGDASGQEVLAFPAADLTTVGLPTPTAPDTGVVGVPGQALAAVTPDGGPGAITALTEEDLRRADAEGADSARTGSVLVRTDGSPAALERARTLLDLDPAVAAPALTRAEDARVRDGDTVLGLAALADVGIGIAVVVAGVSLTVATAAAVLDRRRVLGLLRLTGMPLRTLRRIVVLESLAPLAATVLVAIGLGFAVSAAIVQGFSVERTMSAPGWSYVTVLGVGLVLVAACVLMTTRLVGRTTGTDQTRFE